MRNPNRHSYAIQRIVFCVVAVWASALFAQEKPVATLEGAPQTVASLDTVRYMGNWYEVARFPNRFQTQCVAKVQAKYSLLPEGRIEVQNSCTLANGQTESVTGQAKLGSAGLNTQLKVSFLPAYLRWLPVGWGDYWVIDLARDYRYAVVSDSSRAYLWLLSRSPALSNADRIEIETRLRTQGFDLSKLQNTAQ